MRDSEVNFTPIRDLIDEWGVSRVFLLTEWHKACHDRGYIHVVEIDASDARYGDSYRHSNDALFELFAGREFSNWTLYRGPRYYDIMLMFTNVEDAVYAKLML